jgi:hypothetical protein
MVMLQLHIRKLIRPTTSVATGFALMLTLADPASAQHAWFPSILGPPGIESGATDVNDRLLPKNSSASTARPLQPPARGRTGSTATNKKVG